jgi:hypothetical protein
MKKKRAAQLRQPVASTRRISVSAPARRSLGGGGFLNLCILLGLLVFCLELGFVLLASAKPQTPARMHTLDSRTQTYFAAANADDGKTESSLTAFNDQSFRACGLFETFDVTNPPALPPGWTAINAINPDGILWQTSNSGDPIPPAESLPNAAWINDPDAISDKYLYSPSATIDPLSSADLHFSNNYALEDGFDGGVLEISVDAAPFQDILAAGGFFARGGYNGTISTCCGSPLAGRQAWTGNSGGFIDTDVNLTGFAGHTIVLRWRMGSDSSNPGQGWRIDNVEVFCERPTPTATPISSATMSPTATASPTPSATFTPTSTPTITPPPTPTATPTLTSTPRLTPTPRLHPTPVPRP